MTKVGEFSRSCIVVYLLIMYSLPFVVVILGKELADGENQKRLKPGNPKEPTQEAYGKPMARGWKNAGPYLIASV